MILPSNIRYILRTLFWIWLFLILVLMIIPTNGVSLYDFQGRDKLIHFGLFGFLGFFFVATRAKWNGSFRINLNNRNTYLLLLFSLSVEFLQFLFPYRSFELLDILMNVLGLVSGIVVGRLFMLHFFKG